jgi:hypothetical protein
VVRWKRRAAQDVDAVRDRAGGIDIGATPALLDAVTVRPPAADGTAGMRTRQLRALRPPSG